ncbi:hypothetical protein K1T71_011467 [Dendrolimus kikuchii]|uniref:Uncharacterized protein n=1 Tax=Dendrolimus kikuchii TaxID=765133 RepID=A0ACC1CP33_9NEOP|nr:hypothetical protein K1T71_011467 [Dendrolimus kikuchii]
MTEPAVNQYQVKRPRIPGDRDVPLRAQSVCLAERPRSKYDRAIRSADPNGTNYPAKKFRRQTSYVETKSKSNTVVVKQQNRKIIQKVPFAVSVQNLSIPMKYADDPKPRHSNSVLCNRKPFDINKTKSGNPPKQVAENKRLCHTTRCAKETENKLLLQISEAEQVSDFERILNSNAIANERVQRHVWRDCVAAHTSASVVPRPRSAYSLYAVSQAYQYLFKQHEDSLQPLIDEYRQATDEKTHPQPSILDSNWYDKLQDLTEFYEDDQALKDELQNITDHIITEEVKSVEDKSDKRYKNFNVNLAGLIGLHVEGCSPNREDIGPSPEVDKQGEEWLRPIMSAPDDSQNSHHESTVDCLAQNLDSVKIDSDAKIPTITFSNCCDGYNRTELPNNTEVIHLAVPSIDSINESRPPMM